MSDSKESSVSRWDLAAIVILGAAGCVLSYDALQQMGVAMHIRGKLTYVFPVVIDGFISYGVRALVLLRNAPISARIYTWVLFGGATAASIWANALHAVTLNEEVVKQPGLRLSNLAVGLLSTLAPLALGGAVHLYLLIRRHAPGDQGTAVEDRTVELTREPTCPSHEQPQPALESEDTQSLGRPLRHTALTVRQHPHQANQEANRPDPQHNPYRRTPVVGAADGGRLQGSGPVEGGGVHGAPGGGPVEGPAVVGAADGGRLQGSGPVEGGGVHGAPGGGPVEGGGVHGAPAGGPVEGPAVSGPRLVHLDEDRLPELLQIARAAAAKAGRINRTVVGEGIRTSGRTVSNADIGPIVEILRNDDTAGRHR